MATENPIEETRIWSPVSTNRSPSPRDEEGVGGIVTRIDVSNDALDAAGAEGEEVGMCWLADAMGARRPVSRPSPQEPGRGAMEPEQVNQV
jgi:hypothetical protein